MSSEFINHGAVDQCVAPQALLDRFHARAILGKFAKGQSVLIAGDLDADIYWIQQGRVQFSLMSAQGKEVILRDMGAGEIFGESAALTRSPRSVSATALTDCSIARLSGSEFVQLLHEKSEIGIWLADVLARRVGDLTATVFEMATLPVAGRVQLALLKMLGPANEKSDQKTIKALPTHVELAAKVGTHREAVTRELNILKKEGIIQKRGRDLQVLSVSKLRASYNRFTR
jgi:CRP-like cAMP-binding protein